VAYDYVAKKVYLINHSLDREGSRTVKVEVLTMNGMVISSDTISVSTQPNQSMAVIEVSALAAPGVVVFLKLVLLDGTQTLSRNVYWVAPTLDALDWDNSTWYHTPVTKYADYTALSRLSAANISVSASQPLCGGSARAVMLENHSPVPAFFMRLNLVDAHDGDVVPVLWSDNYVTLRPHEKLELKVSYISGTAATIKVSGGNVAAAEVRLP